MSDHLLRQLAAQKLRTKSGVVHQPVKIGPGLMRRRTTGLELARGLPTDRPSQHVEPYHSMLVYRNLEDKLPHVKTGHTGSIRRARFMATPDPVTVAANTRVPLNQEYFRNDEREVYFITSIRLTGSHDSVGAPYPNLFLRIQPTGGPAWMGNHIPVLGMFSMEGNGQGYSSLNDEDTIVYYLPEPYPVAPGGSVSIELWSKESANSISVVLGLVGHFESLPAYKEPRFSPYFLSERIASLADAAKQRFSRQAFYPGFDMTLQWFKLTVQVNAPDLLFRLRLMKHNRIVERAIPWAVTASPYSRRTPLFDTLMARDEGLLVDVVNQVGSALTNIDGILAGYRSL